MNIFQLADNDQSVMYLGQIFGNVGVALAGSGSAILANMFKTFNTILLVFGAFFIVYITVVGVMTSAQEGEFMKKWNSLWTPLRMLIGIVALFPTSSGYCASQVVVMWLVIQGIGAADMVWKTTVDYIGKGGSIHPQLANPNAATGTPGGGVGQLTVPDNVARLFGSTVCQALVVKFRANDKSAVGRSDLFSGSVMTNAGDNPEEIPVGYRFGRPKDENDPPGSPETINECGEYYWRVWNKEALSKGLSSAFVTLVPVLESIANTYVNNAIDSDCWDPLTQEEEAECSKKEPSAACPTKWFGKGKFNPDKAECLLNKPSEAWGKVLSYGGSNFLSDSIQMLAGYANNYAVNQAVEDAKYEWKDGKRVPKTGSQINSELSGPYKKAQANGWIFAGSYYYYISNQAAKSLSSTTTFYQAINVPEDITKIFFESKRPDSQYYRYPDLRDMLPSGIEKFYCTPSTDGQTLCKKDGGGAVGLVFSAKIAMESAQATGGGMVLGRSGQGGGGPAADALSDTATSTIQNWMNNLAGSSSSDKNPVVNIAYFGKTLLNTAEVLFWVFFGITIGLGFLQTYIVIFGNTVNPVAGVAASLLGFFTPVVFFFVGYMITVGTLLGVYVPLIPYILFTVGAIGWFIAVIEAMVAAPIIALGILSPGGQHEVLGRAEPAIMILLNVILRPTLMIFGMIAAMLLSYVVLNMINGAFLGVVGSIGGEGTMGYIEDFGFIMAYAGLVITALNKCFELIHVIPNKALRWIGGQAEGGGEAEAAEQVKGKVSAGGEAAGRGAAGVGSKAAEGAKASEKAAEEGTLGHEAKQKRLESRGGKKKPPKTT